MMSGQKKPYTFFQGLFFTYGDININWSQVCILYTSKRRIVTVYVFFATLERLLAVNYFYYKLHLRCFTYENAYY